MGNFSHRGLEGDSSVPFGDLPSGQRTALSMAISQKRIADALTRIADTLDGTAMGIAVEQTIFGNRRDS